MYRFPDLKLLYAEVQIGWILSCFFKDRVGVELIDKVGLDNQQATDKIARGNAVRLLGLDLPDLSIAW